MNVACILLEVEYFLNSGHVLKHAVTLSCSNVEECVQNVDKGECADACCRLCIRRPVCEVCNQRSSNNAIKCDACDTVAGSRLLRVVEEQ